MERSWDREGITIPLTFRQSFPLARRKIKLLIIDVSILKMKK